MIGVAPETFPGMQIFAHPDFYMPLAMAPVFSTNLQKNFFEDRDDRELNVKARLKPGTTLQQAQNELGGAGEELRDASIRSSTATAARRCTRSSKCGREVTT